MHKMLNTHTLRNQYFLKIRHLLGIYLITATFLAIACSPTEPEPITIMVHDTLTVHDTLNTVIHDTVTTIAEISISPIVRGRWGDGWLVAYMEGTGINRSDEVIKDVSLEFTLSRFQYTKGILSETVGYFTLDTVIPQYMPNSPFPYEIQHDLEPHQGIQFYVSTDTVFNESKIYWSHRVIVGSGLTKRVGGWQYGGEIKNE